MKDVLIVDDEPAMRAALEANFHRRGWRVRAAAGVGEALLKFRREPSRLVVTDMRMPDGDGLQVMQAVRTCAPETQVILLTAYGSVPDAVQAIREGACDYLQKPVAFEDLEAVAERFIEAHPERPGSDTPFEGVCVSSAFQRVIAQAGKVAQTDADVLIQAESGTGKELLARLIHNASPRSRGPFIAVNCAAVPESLLESELFGHVRGAFTGASANKPGKFELANGGTLLLDEIGEMALSLQPKLLRALQERRIDRLGDTRSMPVDVRVIATTNRPLKEQVAAGEFRADLYYRLNVVPLTIPPLRERPEDILPLAEFFLQKYRGGQAQGFAISPEFAAQLAAHCWPGNVRELENVIRRALALATGPRLGAQVFDAEPASPSLPKAAAFRGPQPGLTLQEMERQLLERTLEATGGNRTRAAELMGVSLRTVRNKIREYGLPARSTP